MAGLIPASAGEVRLNDRAVESPPREVIYLFQQYSKSVFPWKSVMANVMFGIGHRPSDGDRPDRAAIARRCVDMLDLVGLRDFKDYYPYQLSGGMQQRVAIARALVCRPEVLLMDEPLGALDALTRADLQDAILALWHELRPTIVFVTHDIDEAIYLSEDVVVLTRAPARVSQSIPIKLEYPRHQIETREQPAYLDYRRQILADITRR
jgi:NitT/TauT family transport system ATP-binding protein